MHAWKNLQADQAWQDAVQITPLQPPTIPTCRSTRRGRMPSKSSGPSVASPSVHRNTALIRRASSVAYSRQQAEAGRVRREQRAGRGGRAGRQGRQGR